MSDPISGRIAPGSRIQSYRIVRELGRGGMGSVWLAEDPRLGRSVAIKLLPVEIGNDPKAVQRFESEARLSSSINHPHIISIFDIGEFDKQRFIVMEAVEGGTLRDRLSARPFTLREIVDIGIQMGEALAAAHAANVIHRDLKPENVFLTRSGHVKLGDFGVAKLREEVDQTLIRSGAAKTTMAGTILGSPHYMSPEQARAEEVDARTDVFSFAAVLYELAARRRAFEGDSLAEVFAQVLNTDPPGPSEVNPAIVPRFDEIILKGLEKDRDYRYQHVVEMVVDLKRLRRDVESGRVTVARVAAARPSSPTRPWSATTIFAALLSAIAASMFVYFATRGRSEAEEPWELTRLTSEAGAEEGPSFSPDSRSFVYAALENGHLGLRMRQVDGERAITLSPPEIDEAQPAWSPDGSRVAFVSTRNHGGRFGIFFGARPIEFYVYGQNGDLFVMPALGGTVTKLADNAYDPSWSPDAKSIVFRSIRDGAWRLWIVSVDDRKITPLRGVEPRAIAPRWSPDGKWIAFIGSPGAATGWDLFVIPAAGGKPLQLTSDAASIVLDPAWGRDSRSIVFSSNRSGPLNLWRIGFDPERGAATGGPQRTTTGVGEDVNASFSADGTKLVFSTVHSAPNIWKLDLGTRTVTQLTAETTTEDYPRVSRDARSLLFYSDRAGTYDVWMSDLTTGEIRRVSRGGATHSAWSPDGKWVVYTTPRGLRIYTLATDQTAALAEDLVTEYPAVSPDGKWICFQGRKAGSGIRLYRIPSAGGRPVELSTPPGKPGNPAWTADGTKIHYQLDDELSRRNIWVLDLTTGRSTQASSGNTDDAHPDVSPDGKLMFLRNHHEFYVADSAAGEPKLVYAYTGYDKLVEYPAWADGGKSIVFSLAEKTGDIFQLSRTGAPESP